MDPLTGEHLNLTVSQDRFLGSVHGKLLCLKCHGEGYKVQPHASNRRRDAFACLSCHGGDDALSATEKDHFKNEILQSVHKKDLGKRLDCNACHDPHAFERLGALKPALRIPKSNAICLKCHGPKGAEGAFKEAQPLPSIHEWLPNRKAHHTQVACVTCHGGEKGTRPHLLVVEEKMVRSCEQCHTPNTGSLAAQYKTGKNQPSDDLFLSDAMWNEAYVIGATRFPVLDAISMVFFGLTLLTLLGHGLARIIMARRRDAAP
jgi:predicted CXXCH cytochrome family protein